METCIFKNLKSYHLVALFVISIALLASCEKDSYNNYGFDFDFGKNSSGLTMMNIGSNTTFIRLSGNIFMDTGEMKVEFLDSEGYMVFTQNFYSPGYYFVNETFKASPGVWKLRYTSLEGCGSIDLHADFR